MGERGNPLSTIDSYGFSSSSTSLSSPAMPRFRDPEPLLPFPLASRESWPCPEGEEGAEGDRDELALDRLWDDDPSEEGVLDDEDEEDDDEDEGEDPLRRARVSGVLGMTERP